MAQEAVHPSYTPDEHVYYTGLFEAAATYHRMEWMRLINQERMGQREYNASSQDASSHASSS